MYYKDMERLLDLPRSTVQTLWPIPEAALDLIVSDLLTTDMNWNKSRNEELLPNLSTQIQCLRPGHPETEDIFIWQPLPSSVYSARSGYCAAVSQKQTSCSTQTKLTNDVEHLFM